MKDRVAIRTATPGDHDMLSDLLAAAYGELKGSYDPHGLDAALPFMSRANPKLLASGTYYVAEIDGAGAGCGGWTREKPGSGEIAEGLGHIRISRHIRPICAWVWRGDCWSTASPKRARRASAP